MTTDVQRFADAVLDRYRGILETSVVDDVRDDLAAGEYEVAAITIVEMAPVTAAEVDELEALAKNFIYSTDINAARSVIAKQRKRLSA